MNFVDTAMSASCGQGRNQSIVQPLMRPGKFLARVENLSPTGEKHRHRCRLSRTRPMKKLQSYPRVHRLGRGCSSSPRAIVHERVHLVLGEQPATSPVIRSWLMYSKNASSFTSASVKMNAHLLALQPGDLYSALRSSNRFAGCTSCVIVDLERNAPAMYAASRVSDCFPLPPTPMRSAEPAIHAQQPRDAHHVLQRVFEQHQLELHRLDVSLNIACLSSRRLSRCDEDRRTRRRTGSRRSISPVSSSIAGSVKSRRNTPAPLPASAMSLPYVSLMSFMMSSSAPVLVLVRGELVAEHALALVPPQRHQVPVRGVTAPPKRRLRRRRA